MAHEIDYEAITITLDPNEMVQTKAGGGLMKRFKRILTGESFSLRPFSSRIRARAKWRSRRPIRAINR